MKPQCERGSRLPKTDFSFHAGLGEWRGSFSPFDDNSAHRRFERFNRELLMESARERAKEAVVFGLVVLAAAWPVIYMVITVVKLLVRGQPLDQ